MILQAVTGWNPFAAAQHYYETAPDGTYLQKEWGWVNSISFPHSGGWLNNVTSWTFARCEHDYLGPLHGSWKVQEGVSVPIWQQGVFPIDSRLYITLINNIVVNVEIKSAYEYGN